MISIAKSKWMKILPGLMVVILVFMIYSCSNDIKKVNALTSLDSIPDICIDKIIVKQSESGTITLELTAPQLRSFIGREPYTEFPKGIRIVFFDSLMRPKSELTAKYGISWDNKRIMEAKGDVVVKNFAKQAQLNTEHLTWNENNKKMISDQFVKITTPDKIVTGSGMESDEVFDNWVVRNVAGIFYVNENK
jgi:LPS export ABC transporter protein LptC